jgi:hypothetical protein
VAGPNPPAAFQDFIAQGVAFGGNVAKPVWAPGDWLTERGVEPWSDLPLLTSLTGEHSPLARVDSSKSVAAGLQLRTVDTTTRDTIEWWRNERLGSDPRWGLSDEKEAALLEELARKGAPD